MITGITIPTSFEVNQNYFKHPTIVVVGIINIPPTKKEKPKWLIRAEEEEIQKLREERKKGQNIDLYT